MGERSSLPVWVQGWLEAEAPVCVFVAERREAGPYIVDANEAGKAAFERWTGLQIPVEEKNPEHAAADLAAWKAFSERDVKKLASLVFYREEMEGRTYETVKTPISDTQIVIITRPTS